MFSFSFLYSSIAMLISSFLHYVFYLHDSFKQSLLSDYWLVSSSFKVFCLYCYWLQGPWYVVAVCLSPYSYHISFGSHSKCMQLVSELVGSGTTFAWYPMAHLPLLNFQLCACLTELLPFWCRGFNGGSWCWSFSNLGCLGQRSISKIHQLGQDFFQ